MPTDTEAFHGTWRFNPQLSKICTPAPHSWIQEISAGSDQVAVREQIVRPNGTEIVRRVQFRLDGTDYPVEGSLVVDTIACTRAAPNSFVGVGKKDGTVSMTETVVADPEKGTLTLIYNYLLGERTFAHGVAVFQSA